MAYISYTAKDGIKNLDDETLIVSGGIDSIQSSNLVDPLTLSNWNDWNNGATSAYENIGVKLTNNSPGSSAGSSYLTYTSDSSKYYCWRGVCNSPGGLSTQGGRLIVGTTISGSQLGASGYPTEYNQVVFKGTGSTVYLQIQNQSTVQDSNYWSNLELIEVEILGVDETTELVTNGTFDSDITGWTDNSAAGGAIAWNASGYMDLIDTTGNAIADQSITTVSGSIYKISIDKISAAGNLTIAIGTTSGGSDVRYIVALTSAASYEYYFSAQGTTTYLRIVNSAAGTTTQVDNVSCTLSGNLVTNGDFTDTTNKDWNEGTGWTISGGTATHSSGTASLSYPATPVYNGEYIVKYTISGYSAGTVYPGMNGGDNGTQRSANGTYTETLTAGSGSLFGFNPSTDFVGSIDDVTIIKAVPDISSNGDGIEIHGEIIKVPVNFDSTPVAFTNFSNDVNYLEQPYNSALDYGVTGFHIKGWFRSKGNSGAEVICSRGYYTGAAWSGSWWEIYLGSSGNVVFVVTDDGNATADTITSTGTYDDNEWHHFVIALSGDGASPGANQYINLYIDGAKDASQKTMTAALASLDNSSATFIIGTNQPYNSAFDNGEIALLSTSPTVPTLGQVNQIYESEKILFEPDSVYSISGDSLGIEIDLSNTGQRGAEINKVVQNTLDGSRFTLVHSIKRNWQVSSVWIAKAELKYLRKFIEAVMRGDELTFDERGYQYAPDFPISVYADLDSVMYGKLDNDYYNVSFKVRET